MISHCGSRCHGNLDKIFLATFLSSTHKPCMPQQRCPGSATKVRGDPDPLSRVMAGRLPGLRSRRRSTGLSNRLWRKATILPYFFCRSSSPAPCDWGLVRQFLASVLGFISWDVMFIPPRFSLIVTTPQDYMALGVYLLAGITTAQLAAQARRKTEESEARGREITMLYRIGQIVSSESDPGRMIDTLIAQIVSVCPTDRCVIFPYR